MNAIVVLFCAFFTQQLLQKHDNTKIFVWRTEFIQIVLISEFETNTQTTANKQSFVQMDL